MYTEEENKKYLQKIAILEDDLKNIRNRMQNLQSTILSNISHDIRTPMNAIVGFANLLANEKMDKSDRNECIYQINTSSIELLEMIDNMIDASLLQCGNMKLYEKECCLNEIMDDLFKSFRGLSNVKQKRLNLIVSKGEDENYFIVADDKRLRQVLRNLIGNAIKYTETGFIEFGYQRYKKNRIRFFVKDSGIGLSSLTNEDIFKPFFSRLSPENGNVKKGPGLGLAVSKKIVELMGGEIVLESVPGKGTCLYFMLPEKRYYLIKKKLREISMGIKLNIAGLYFNIC